jgi:hypothetical protein
VGGPCMSGAAIAVVNKKQLETQPAMSLLIRESPFFSTLRMPAAFSWCVDPKHPANNSPRCFLVRM